MEARTLRLVVTVFVANINTKMGMKNGWSTCKRWLCFLIIIILHLEMPGRFSFQFVSHSLYLHLAGVHGIFVTSHHESI